MKRSRLGHSGQVSIVALALGLATAPSAVMAQVALPSAGQVVGGEATIRPVGGDQLVIDQSTNRAVIDWQSFSIGAGGTVQFNNGAGATLNRVIGGDPSAIAGTLRATGSLYLVNPAGVLVDASGRVLTGGSFVASTLPLSADGFMAGATATFRGASGGAVENRGQIVGGGDVVLVGSAVRNGGSITAGGLGALAAGSSMILREAGADGRIAVEGPSGDVTNSGSIQAMTAELRAAGGNVYALAGSSGVVRATGTELRGGRIWLTAGKDIAVEQGAVLDASANASKADGGDIMVLATQGRVQFAGSALARGGSLGGDGGFIETSGWLGVNLAGARIDASSAAGKAGTWLIDPFDLLIDAAAADSISMALNFGSNVTVATTGANTSSGGPGTVVPNSNGDIFINSRISWTSSATLTLDAWRNIKIDGDINAPDGGLELKIGRAGGLTGFLSDLTRGQASPIIRVRDLTLNGPGQFKLGDYPVYIKRLLASQVGGLDLAVAGVDGARRVSIVGDVTAWAGTPSRPSITIQPIGLGGADRSMLEVGAVRIGRAIGDTGAVNVTIGGQDTGPLRFTGTSIITAGGNVSIAGSGLGYEGLQPGSNLNYDSSFFDGVRLNGVTIDTSAAAGPGGSIDITGNGTTIPFEWVHHDDGDGGYDSLDISLDYGLAVNGGSDINAGGGNINLNGTGGVGVAIGQGPGPLNRVRTAGTGYIYVSGGAQIADTGPDGLGTGGNYASQFYNGYFGGVTIQSGALETALGGVTVKGQMNDNNSPTGGFGLNLVQTQSTPTITTQGGAVSLDGRSRGGFANGFLFQVPVGLNGTQIDTNGGDVSIYAASLDSYWGMRQYVSNRDFEMLGPAPQIDAGSGTISVTAASARLAPVSGPALKTTGSINFNVSDVYTGYQATLIGGNDGNAATFLTTADFAQIDAGQVNLVGEKTISIGGELLGAGGRRLNLSLNSNFGAIQQTGSFTAGNFTARAAGGNFGSGIALGSSSNDVLSADLRTSNGSIQFRDDNGFNLVRAVTDPTTNFTVTLSSAGTVTQNSGDPANAIVTGGLKLIGTGASSSFQLTNTNNSFSTPTLAGTIGSYTVASTTGQITSQPSIVLPTGGTLVSGQATIGAPSGGVLTIDQGSSRAVIDWSTFNIGAGGLVQFNNGTGATLNRVTGSADPSTIDGRLQATGSVYLINPAGLVVSNTGTVLTSGAFVFSSQPVSAADFMSGGNLLFSGSETGSVLNSGTITGSDVVLLGRSVTNNGSIIASGFTGLATGDSFTLTNASGSTSGPAFTGLTAGGSSSDDITSGSITSGTVNLTAANGSIDAGPITATGAVSITAGPSHRIRLLGNIDAGSGTIGLSSGLAGIYQSGGGLKAASLTATATGTSIVLDSATNQVGTFSATMATADTKNTEIRFRNATNFTVAGINAGDMGNVALTAGAGLTVTQLNTGGGVNGRFLGLGGGADFLLTNPTNAVSYLDVSNTAQTGTIRLVNTGDLTVANSQLRAGSVLVQNTGNLTLGSGSIELGGTGDALVLQTSGTFQADDPLLTALPGRLLVFVTDPSKLAVSDGWSRIAKTFYGRSAAAYNAGGAGSSITATGNRFVFASTPTATVTPLARTVTYDGQAYGAQDFLVARQGLVDTAGGFSRFDDPSEIVAAGFASETRSTVRRGADGTVLPWDITVLPWDITATNLSSPIGYNVLSGIGQLTISPKALTVTGLSAASKIYDGTTVASLSGGTLAGVVGSDAVTLAGLTGSFASKDAGSAIAVTVTGASLSGAAAGNYTVANPTGLSADITARSLSLALTGSTSKVYDGTTAALLSGANFSLSGFVAGEGASITQTAGSFDNGNAGTGKTVSVSLAGGDYTASGSTLLANYVLPTAVSGAIGTISPKALSYAVQNASSTYGTVATVGTVRFTGLVSSDSVTAVTLIRDGSGQAIVPAANTAAGTYAVTVSGLSGAAASNYVLASSGNSPGTLTIGRAPLQVAVGLGALPPAGAVATRSVGQVNPSVQYLFTGLVAGDTAARIASELTPTGLPDLNSIGSYSISIAQTQTANYTLSVSPATLVVIAQQANAPLPVMPSSPTLAIPGSPSSVTTVAPATMPAGASLAVNSNVTNSNTATVATGISYSVSIQGGNTASPSGSSTPVQQSSGRDQSQSGPVLAGSSFDLILEGTPPDSDQTGDKPGQRP